MTPLKNILANKAEILLTALITLAVISSSTLLYYYLIRTLLNIIHKINTLYEQLPESTQTVIFHTMFIIGMVVFQRVLLFGFKTRKRRILKGVHKRKVLKQTQKHINTLNHHKL